MGSNLLRGMGRGQVSLSCGCAELQCAHQVKASDLSRQEMERMVAAMAQRRHPAVAEDTVIFDHFPIRDTNNHFPLYTLTMVGMAAAIFDLENQHNQTVTWQMLGGSYPEPTAMGLIGVSGTIAATTREPIVTNIYSKFLTLRLNYATAPTSGFVHVLARANPRFED